MNHKVLLRLCKGVPAVPLTSQSSSGGIPLSMLTWAQTRASAPFIGKSRKYVFRKWAQTRASAHLSMLTWAQTGASATVHSSIFVDPLWGLWAPSWSSFGCLWGSLWGPLGRLGGSLVTLGGYVGLTLLDLGPPWPPFGYTLAAFFMNLGTLGAYRVILGWS